jgi:hypothetical protein
MAKLALCVGINLYGSGSDLSGCVNDCSDWSAALRECGFEVTKVLDRDATGKNIRAAITELVAKGAPGDLLVSQYSGHGSYTIDTNGDEPDGKDECICPADIFSKGPIIDDELSTLYSKRKPNVRLVIISDSCHSGSVSRFMPTIAKKGSKVKFLPPASFLSERQINKLGKGFRWSVPIGRHAGLLLSGCSDPEFSYDSAFNGRPNGAFTRAALDALKKIPKGSSYQRWLTAYRKILPSQDFPQTPVLYGSSTQRRWHALKQEGE